MDLDNYKQLWSKEEISETPEISLEKQTQIHTPLEKIRKNMRMEFWSTTILLILVLGIIWLFPLPYKFRLYIFILVFSMTLVTMFFYHRFFKLYKEIGNLNLKTLESLKDLLFQFELNKQYYVSFYLSFVPFVVCEMILTVEFSPNFNYVSDFVFTSIFVGSIVFGLIALYILGRLFFQYFYGKYIQKIKTLVRDLQE